MSKYYSRSRKGYLSIQKMDDNHLLNAINRKKQDKEIERKVLKALISKPMDQEFKDLLKEARSRGII